MYDHGSQPTISDHRPCAEALETKAKKMKASLDVKVNFVAATRALLESGEVNPYEFKDEMRVLYSMFGAYTLLIPQLQKSYETLLKEIEKST